MRPYVLTIAGFDPSAGAGILADIKTFEQNGCLGMAVNTANTVQTEDKFISTNWVDDNVMLNQWDALLKRYRFKFAKVGLIRSFELLEKVKAKLIEHGANVIWDPILSTSTGFDFEHNMTEIRQAMMGCYLVTPNQPELNKIQNYTNWEEMLVVTNILLKGGHADDKGTDILYYHGEEIKMKAQRKVDGQIHGSGCILSSAITANLAQGSELKEAIKMAKTYIEDRLGNKEGLLTYHS